MPEATLIRAQAGPDGKVTVRMRMTHEMETGQRKDEAGKTIAPWFIQEVTVTHNGKPVLTAEWGPAISKDPFVQFTLRGAKVGDRIGVAWKDNRGETRRDEAAVT